MVDSVVVESKPLLTEGKPKAWLTHLSAPGWRLSAAWLPVAAIFGALCTLAVIAVPPGGSNGWWLEFEGHRTGTGTVKQRLRPIGSAAPYQQQQEQQLQRQQRLSPQRQAELEAWGERLQVPWGALLTGDEAARGLTYWGSGERMKRVAAKLLAGQPIKVFALGASVTRGIGATSPSLTYVSRFFEFLNSTFPHSDHQFHNRGIGGTNSGVYAVCAEHMVHEDADLVVIEFTINDPRDTTYADPERRAYEQLVRKVMALPGRPALLQLHHWAWWHAVGDGVEDGGLFYYPPGEAQLGVFAQYYDFPSLSVRASMWRLMHERAPMFNPDKQRYGTEGGFSPTEVWIPSAKPGTERDYWYRDRTHPGNEGHGTLAELLASAVSHAVFQVLDPRPSPQLWAAPGGQRSRMALGRDDLPPPMVPGNLAVPTSLCAIEEAFKGIVVASDGFTYKPERPAAPTFAEQKWGWTGAQPGAWAELEFDSAAGFEELNANSTAGMNAQVSLSFLRSYEGMGVADVACVSGCSCPPSALDGTWERRVSMQSIAQFWVTRNERCRVRVTIADRAGQVPQEGHKVSLSAVMVSQWALRLAKYDEQLQALTQVTH